VFAPSEQAFRLLDCLLFQARASPHEPASNYPAFPFAAPRPSEPVFFFVFSVLGPT
jgi:hypothetical protein